METRAHRPLGGLEIPVHVARSAEEAARAVAGVIAGEVRARREAGRGAVLGLATGRTPVAVYAELARRVREGALSLADVTSFNLDEYVGLDARHPASFHDFVRRHVVEPTDLPGERAHLPRGDAADPQAEAARYERAIAEAGGIDLQLLGLGTNGHIGFNEPGSPRDSRTRVVTLKEETREANASEFPRGEAVPERAFTMGVATILAARRVVVLALGPRKTEAVRRMLTGPVDASCPASFVRGHAAAELWLDEAAAAGLDRGAR